MPDNEDEEAGKGDPMKNETRRIHEHERPNPPRPRDDDAEENK